VLVRPFSYILLSSPLGSLERENEVYNQIGTINFFARPCSNFRFGFSTLQSGQPETVT